MKLSHIKPLQEDSTAKKEGRASNEDIEGWVYSNFLYKGDFNPDDFSINDDGAIDYRNTIKLADISEIQYPFNEVEDFIIYAGISGKIKSLKNCPRCVIGNFLIDDQEITSLEHSPEQVGGSYEIKINKIPLSSLKGITPEVTHLKIIRCGLKSLEHFPKVDGNINISKNLLTDLKHLPKTIDGNFYCCANKLTKLDDLPEKVNGNVDIANNKLTSLKDIHKYLKEVNGDIAIGNQPIKSNILGLLLIKGLTAIYTLNNDSSSHLKQRTDSKLYKAIEILNKHLGQGKAGVLAAQNELIENDLDDFAEL